MAKGKQKRAAAAKAKEEKYPTSKTSLNNKNEKMKTDSSSSTSLTANAEDLPPFNVIDDDSIIPLHGLTNLGNTCFFNSTVQCLISTRPLLSLLPNLSSMPIPLPLHSKVISFMTDYISPQKKNGVTISPANLFSEISRGNSTFRGSKQQDAHELLRYLISTLVAEGEEREAAERKKAGLATLSNWDANSVEQWCNSCCLPMSIYHALISLASKDEKQLNGQYLYSLVESDTKEVKRKRAKLVEGIEENEKNLLIKALTNIKRGILDHTPSHSTSSSSSFPSSRSSAVSNHQLIQNLFKGILDNTVECLTCHFLSQTQEIFYDLSLSIEPPGPPNAILPIKNAWAKGKGKSKSFDNESRKQQSDNKKEQDKEKEKDKGKDKGDTEIPESSEKLTFPATAMKKKKQTPNNLKKPSLSKHQRKLERKKVKKKLLDSEEKEDPVDTNNNYTIEKTDTAKENEVEADADTKEDDESIKVKKDFHQAEIIDKKSGNDDNKDKEEDLLDDAAVPCNQYEKVEVQGNTSTSVAKMMEENSINKLTEDISRLEIDYHSNNNEEIINQSSLDNDMITLQEMKLTNDENHNPNYLSFSEEEKSDSSSKVKEDDNEKEFEANCFILPTQTKIQSDKKLEIIPTKNLSTSNSKSQHSPTPPPPRPITPPSPSLLARYSSLGATRLIGECSVMDCLSAYFDYELLSGSESYACEKCGEIEAATNKKESEERKESEVEPRHHQNERLINMEEIESPSSLKIRSTVKRNAQKRLIINSPPPILTLHLKRFSANLSGRLLEKLNKNVIIDWILDLSPFVKQQNNNHPNSEESAGSGISYEYELYGIVCHSGGMSGGHYISYSKRGSDRWVMCSDTHTSVVSIKDVASCQPYILFYKRKQRDKENIKVGSDIKPEEESKK